MGKVIYSEDQFSLSKKVKKARIEMKFSQKDLGSFLNTSQSYISKLESGQIKIDVVTLKKIATILKKPFEFFI